MYVCVMCVSLGLPTLGVLISNTLQKTAKRHFLLMNAFSASKDIIVGLRILVIE